MKNLSKLNLDYLVPIAIWLLIFQKNIFSNLLFVDYVSPTYLDIGKFIKLSNYTYVFSLFDILKIIATPLNLFYLLFTFSILIAMLVSYFYIKRTFKDKPLVYSILFSLIYLFNPFVYSRIMIGQLGVLLAYLAVPVYLYYLFAFFESGLNKKSMLKLAIAFTLCSSISIHFFALNLIIFIIASFWFDNDKIKLSKYIGSIVLLVILLILLNSFWIQGFFDNKVFSTIDSDHEFFFSPKMSEHAPAVSKILGMYGFWREIAETVPYKQLPLYVSIIGLSTLVILMLIGYSLSTSKKSKLFFTLFWIGLIFGTGISHPYTKPFFDFLFQNLPFFNGFRDSHKFVSFIALAYAYFIPITIIKLKSKIKPVYLIILTSLLVLFILAYTYPLIGLNNQIQPISYPNSYYETNNYLEQQSITGNIIYLPFENYLTYSWSITSSSDGRVAVPIDQILKEPIIIGADKWGTADEITAQVSNCLYEKSISCLEQSNVEYILHDKCAYYPENYNFITSSLTPVYQNDCINLYKISNFSQIEPSRIPLRFIIGISISLITLIILVYLLFKKSSVFY
ncbi:MAG: hypothetical protein WC979_08165 [Candidatus Pacearchaeota archaeon]|jgi:hypothetical protein